MSVRNEVAVGDDQAWKRAVEEVLDEYRRRIEDLERQLNG